MERILKYLRGTLSRKLLYKSEDKSGILEAFSDADYTGGVKTQRSTKDVVCEYSGGAIIWISQKNKNQLSY